MKRLSLLALAWCLCGCKLFEFHPYDGYVTGETGVNAKNIARIESLCAGKETIRLAMIGDTQGWYDATQDFVRAANRRDDIDFVIHGGDIADFGMTDEFIWQRDILNKLRVPYVVVLGNHDCLGNGRHVYNKIFGEENFSFLAGQVKFVCLNTNAIEYDYSHPVPDFQFLRERYEERLPGHRKTVVAMHAKPYSEQFNNNVAEVFHYMLTRFPGLQFCLKAHDHKVSVDDLFGDGILYYGCANIQKRSYLLFTIKPEGYEYEVVAF